MNKVPNRAVFTHRPADHPNVRSGSIGVLMVNLGTPDATDAKSVRRYLREFLHDKRVIEEDTILWKFVLNAVILPRRPRRKGLDYEKIWNRENNESPLKTITRAQADKLAAALALRGKRVVVDWALRVAPPYFDEPAYIEAVAASLQAHLATLKFAPDVIIASFHGIPKSYFDKGDPYYCHCAKTTRLLRERLGLDDSKLIMTFQSRFGRAEWLKPYTDMTVKELAAQGVKNLVIVTPGFAADCLETLEEIAGENAEYFRHAGGENFAAIPCLNDSEPGMQVIETVVLRELQGWA